MKTILQNGKNRSFFVFIIFLTFVLFVPAQQAQTLVGHWQMESNLNDASGNGNNGTAVGSPTYVTGVVGLALDLDGSTQYGTVPDATTLDITAAITLAAWIKPSSGGTQYIIKKSIQNGTLGTEDGYELSISSSGGVFFRLNQTTAGNTYRVDASTLVPTDGNTWVHIAGTYNGTTLRIYINGLPDNSETPTTPVPIATNGLDLGIGAQSNGVGLFQGAIDDARVYNGALNDAAILSLATVLPTDPILNTPTNGTTGLALPPTLKWYASASAATYQLQVSTVSDFNTTVYNQPGLTTTTVLINGLSDFTQYYWRVNATNSVGTSGWSTVWDFTTSTTLPSIISAGAGFGLDFDGANDYVDCGNDGSVNITGSITMEAWVKPTDNVGTASIIKKFSLGTPNIGYELFLGSGGAISFRLNGPPAIVQLDAASTGWTATSPWMHIAGTYNNTTREMKIYVNGVDEGTTTGPTSITSASSTNLAIGSQLPLTKLYTGQIDEVRLWNVVRSQSDIQANMCKKLSGSESGLVGYWRFDETTGTSMNDETANNNDGTMTNMDAATDHIWSGAALGDVSAYDYIGTLVGDFEASLGIGSETFTATGSGAGTVTGVQVYRVNDDALSVVSTVPSGWTVDPLRYWGAKVFGTGAAYDVVYNYTGHPGIVTEANLRLGIRDNLSDASWDDAGVFPNLVAHTLTLTGQTGTEYTLASNSADPLPVELRSFTAKIINNAVKLNWKTETEVDNYGFDIERTTDKSNWKAIGFVEGHGNSNSPKEYNFSDSDIGQSGKYYYRLNQIDTDGKFEYSDVVSVEVGAPGDYYLSQNYPNPFNPNTIIKYNIPQESFVTIKIYDVIGNEVQALVNSKQEAGVYEVNFNAGNLASGMYFYRMQTNDFVKLRKMLLLK